MIENEEQLKKILQQQAFVTAYEVATYCADICDHNRGQLSVGDMIRKQFNLTKNEEQKFTETEIKPESHLRIVK